MQTITMVVESWDVLVAVSHEIDMLAWPAKDVIFFAINLFEHNFLQYKLQYNNQLDMYYNKIIHLLMFIIIINSPIN